MKNNVKNYLSNIIKETAQSQQDEMARRPKNVRSDDKSFKMRPLFAPENPTKPGDEGIPDGWLINPTAFEGETSFETTEPFIVIPLDCDELESLKSKWGEWFQELEQEHSASVDFISCTRGKYMRPVEKALIGGYKPTGNKMPASERMKRYSVFPTLQEFFNDVNNLEVFNKRSIPVAIWQEKGGSTKEKRARLDNHTAEWTNDKIVIRMHNFNSYKTAQDFLQSAIKRAQGNEDTEVKTYHLARQFNLVYGQWAADRKIEPSQLDPTDIYKLDRYGQTTEDLQVAIKMDMEIVGERTGPADFMWSMKMNTKVGRRDDNSRRVREFLNVFDGDKEISVVKNVTLDPNKTFSDEFPITDDIAVSQGLRELLDEFMTKLKSIKTSHILKYANVASSFQPVDNNLQEQKERLVQRITNKLKTL